VLKGYDQLLNLVLDETLEYLRGALPRQAASALLSARGPPPPAIAPLAGLLARSGRSQAACV
jgi:small nuclear ribonucleoprotein (snRNP)-like protein